MELKERAAYLKGLMEGLEIGDSKEGKVLKAMY
ncbi:CD1247 N-terminal domain-containing protein, partial [Fournierella sp.]